MSGAVTKRNRHRPGVWTRQSAAADWLEGKEAVGKRVGTFMKGLKFLGALVGVSMSISAMACAQSPPADKMASSPTTFDFRTTPAPTAVPLDFDTSDFVTSSFDSTYSKRMSFEISHPESWTIKGPDQQGEIQLLDNRSASPVVTISEGGLMPDHMGYPDATTYISEGRLGILQEQATDFQILEVSSFPAGDRKAHFARYLFRDGDIQKEVLESHIATPMIIYVSAPLPSEESSYLEEIIEAVVRSIKVKVESRIPDLP